MNSRKNPPNIKERHDEMVDRLIAEKIIESIQEFSVSSAMALLAFENPFFRIKRFFFFDTVNSKKVERLIFELEVFFLILVNSYLLGSNQESSMIYIVNKLFG